MSEKKAPISGEEVRNMIAMRAYYKYVERGYQAGSSQQDWLIAEAEILASLPSTAAPIPDTKSRTKVPKPAPAGTSTAKKKVSRAKKPGPAR
ncbi:MAG: DUF2934 domain-containing protein [Acidobacteria bacterium]|nr:DUF2934 domain-containing protein [Acidobacteriota bacterium]